MASCAKPEKELPFMVRGAYSTSVRRANFKGQVSHYFARKLTCRKFEGDVS